MKNTLNENNPEFWYIAKPNGYGFSKLGWFGFVIEEHKFLGLTNCEETGKTQWFKLNRRWIFKNGELIEDTVFSFGEDSYAKLKTFDKRIDYSNLDELKKDLINKLKEFSGE